MFLLNKRTSNNSDELKTIASSKLLYDIAMFGFRVASELLGDVEVKGLKNLPKTGGAIVAANHLSYFDPIVLGGALDRSGRNSMALAKAELYNNKMFGWVLYRMGQIPVYRGTAHASDALVEAIRRVNLGEVIAIYPEGTIPHDGKLMHFKTGVARLALMTEAPVILVAQEGANKVISSDVTQIARGLWNALLLQPDLHVLINEPIYCEGDPNSKEDVIRVTQELEAEMIKLLDRLSKEEWVLRSIREQAFGFLMNLKTKATFVANEKIVALKARA